MENNTPAEGNEGKDAINNKYTELCTQRGALTHQIDRLSKQLGALDAQIDGLDVAMMVVTQLEAGPDAEAQQAPISPSAGKE
jgi:peptidoglycan hydrolase CwlO-like protein